MNSVSTDLPIVRGEIIVNRIRLGLVVLYAIATATSISVANSTLTLAYTLGTIIVLELLQNKK